MCGIAGELRFDNTLPESECLDRMLTILARRGPDHQGVYYKDSLALGHRRLAIIDLSSHANQPFTDENTGLVLVFNGTIYNYRELRQELEAKGYQFSSQSDTEVLLKAYAAWGKACLQRFIGMYAFAIWDSQQQTLFLARDLTGIKPLYYSIDHKRFLFASSLPALLASKQIDCDIDPYGLHYHLTLHGVVPAPRTILKGISKLPPGHYMEVSASGKTNIQAYWQLKAVRSDVVYTDEEYIAELKTRLIQAVKRRVLAADVPVGVLLSGGLDSSLLVALLNESQVGQIKTFSIGFEDQPEEQGSEFIYSDLVAQYFQTEHYQFNIPNKNLLKRLPEAITQMSEPMVGQDAIAFYLLSEQVSKIVKVVQSGQGADEVFAGYFWYPQMNQAVGSDLERFRQYYFDRDHEEFLETVIPAYHMGDITGEYIQDYFQQGNADTYMDKVLRLDVTTLIVDDPVKRVDNMTMAWGLEARVPFLDKEVIEWAAQMPPHLKLQQQGKYALKMIGKNLLPHSIIHRTKEYFPVPALKYVRGAFYKFMQEILLSDTAKQRQLFNFTYTKKLLEKPEDYYTRLQGSKLWHQALLELWLQLVVDPWRN